MTAPLLQAFSPLVGDGSRVLILGSMPSPQSLKAGQYYAHPQNAFWRIIFDLWEAPLTEDYAERTCFLLEHGLALWDVVASCRREGSADSAIRDATPNDFAAFFRQWPQIGRICFNGRVAEQLFRRLVLKDGGYGTLEALRPGLQTIRLGSTSPAHAAPYAVKLAEWRVLRQFV
jgi:hypoxanthine-DNA glycosylase